MFITGPEVVKTVLGEVVTMEELGGARVHSEISGNAHFFAHSEYECFEQIKKLLTFIPWSNEAKAKPFPSKPANRNTKSKKLFLPTRPNHYDVRDIIRAVADDSDFLEVQQEFAKNIVVGFGRIDGETIGFVANQPSVLAGVLDCDSSDKAGRFIRFCDAFNIPIVTFEDMPGYLPGVEQEHRELSVTGLKFFTRIARPRYLRSRLSLEKHTVEVISP